MRRGTFLRGDNDAARHAAWATARDNYAYAIQGWLSPAFARSHCRGLDAHIAFLEGLGWDPRHRADKDAALLIARLLLRAHTSLEPHDLVSAYIDCLSDITDGLTEGDLISWGGEHLFELHVMGGSFLPDDNQAWFETVWGDLMEKIVEKTLEGVV